MRQIRHMLSAVCPPFIRGEQAQSFLNEGIFTIYDADANLWWESLFARFPTYAPADILPYLAADRHIITGPYESEEAIRARLLAWIDEAILAGLPIGWLVAMQAYLAPGYPRVRIVTRRNTWYTLEAGTVPRMLNLTGYDPLPPCPYEGGASWPRDKVALQVERAVAAGLFTRYKASPANWDWDSVSHPERASKWWDFWGIVYPDAYAFDETYAVSSVFDDGGTVGFDSVNYATIDTFRRIAIVRKPAKANLRCVIFAPSSTDFDPSTAPADPSFPDGTWGWTGVDSGGGTTPSRRTDCRYLDNFPRR